jgi:amino acid transporter/nucleotide-binding universal stress UspA family protein
MAEVSQGSAQEPRSDLSRDLGLFDATMIGVAGMIGAGIFVLTGIAAGEAGPALLLAFGLNGVVTLLTGMVYAELGSAIPTAGGGYQWVKQGLPGANAFLAGWIDWFSHTVVGSVYALGFAAYFALVLRDLNIPAFGLEGPALQKAIAAAIALMFVYINFRGASETGRTGNFVTVGKMLIIWIFVIAGLWAIMRNPEQMSSFSNLHLPGLDDSVRGFAPNGITGVFIAMGLTFIAFEGYEIIAQAGEEVRNPRKNIPKAVFLAMIVVIPTYIAVAFVALGAVQVPASEGAITTWQWLSQTDPDVALARAARSFMGPFTILLSIGALLSTMSALNATTYSSTRVAFAMGRDRDLPDMFAAVHPRTRVPHVALIFSGVIITLMAVSIPLEAVAASAGIMFMLLFLQVNVASITIRRKYGDKLRYGYMLPFFPWVQVVAITLQLVLIVFTFAFSPTAALITTGWIVAGLLIHHFYASKRERERDVSPVVAAQMPQIEKRKFSVLVPIANPQTAPSLLAVSHRLLRLKPGNLMLLNVITVPDQLPVSVGRDFIGDSRPLLDEVSAQAEDLGIVPNSLVRIGHRAADAIVDTVEDTHANFVVMGWAGRSRDPRTVIGSTIDRIVKNADANVVVVRGDVKVPAKRILVPVQHPQHASLIAQFAAVMADRSDSYIRLLHVVDRDMPPALQAQRATELREAVARYTEKHKQDVETPLTEQRFQIRVEAGEVVETIAEQSEEFDLVIAGASRESWVRRKVWSDKTAQIARQIQTPLMLVNMSSGWMKFSVSQFFEFFWDIEG